MQKINKILVVGATGSIGRYVVTEALNKGYQVRALVRNPNKIQFDGWEKQAVKFWQQQR